MGFIFNGRHSSDLGLICKTEELPLVPARRRQIEYVQGRDGAYVFDPEGYDERVLVYRCTFPASLDYSTRRYLARQVAAWLSAEEGDLITDAEPDKKYRARVDVSTPAEFGASFDVFVVTFRAHPVVLSIYQNADEVTWDTPTQWQLTDIGWEVSELERTYRVTGEDTLEVENLGTYPAQPIIKLSGTAATVTLADDDRNTCTYTGLAPGTPIYIDCADPCVYSETAGVKTNQRTNFAGSYLRILPGTNTIDVSGDITDVTIEFIFADAYI